MASSYGHQCGCAVVEPPAGREHRARRGGGREFGAVPPCPAGQDHPGGRRELAVAVDDHDGLQAAAADAARLPAHLPVAGHAAASCVAGCAGRVEFVAQVAERVGLALGVRREGRADRREQVRPVQSHRLEFGLGPAEFGEHGGQVGERGVDQPPARPSSVGVTAANPAMMSRAMSLRVVTSLLSGIGRHPFPPENWT